MAVLRFDGTRDTASIERAVVGCGRALVGLLGEPSLTAYDIGFFFPTRDEVARGARWVRCDVVLFVDRTLAPLAEPVVADPRDAAVGPVRGRPQGRLRRHDLRLAPHAPDHRLGAAAGATRLPGRSAPSAQAVRRCASLALDASDLVVVFPSDLEWRAGYRTAACESRTSS